MNKIFKHIFNLISISEIVILFIYLFLILLLLHYNIVLVLPYINMHPPWVLFLKKYSMKNTHWHMVKKKKKRKKKKKSLKISCFTDLPS